MDATRTTFAITPLLDVADVAAILKIGKRAVYVLAETATLPSLHIGRRLRFRREDVEAFLLADYLGGE